MTTSEAAFPVHLDRVRCNDDPLDVVWVSGMGAEGW